MVTNGSQPVVLCLSFCQVVLPQLCFSVEDAELWVEDPQEFVRKGYDVLEDMFSTKTAAANFLHTLCFKKPKAHLHSCMTHLQQVRGEGTSGSMGGWLRLTRVGEWK